MNPLSLIKEFFETLHSRRIEYCHWKSNHAIKSFLQGEGDLDILVSENSQNKFTQALSEYNFKLAISPPWEKTENVHHYYGLDEETGNIVHLHVYFKLLSGGMLIKNYHLALENFLIENSKEIYGIKIPSKSSEFLVFVIRKVIECGTLPDYLFALREEKNIKNEFYFLYDANTFEEAKKHIIKCIPNLPLSLFEECVNALQKKPQFFTRIALSRKLHNVLSDHAINSLIRNKWFVWKKFFMLVLQKFISRNSVYHFASGGALITFVGADGSGKSTHISIIEKWLGKMVFVKRIHTGLPPATWLTFFPRLLLPLLRKKFPEKRTNLIELKRLAGDQSENPDKTFSFLYLFRSIMIAYDQRDLINRARRKTERGKILICDRYPSTTLGGMDGPRVDPSFFGKGNVVKSFLARIEKKIYKNIIKPDLVFKLSVPLEVAFQRISERKEEMNDDPEKQIQCRQAVMDKWELPGVPVHDIDNSAPIEEVQRKIKKIIWGLV